MRFVVVLANERDADETHEDDDAFLEELLWALLPLAEAADKSVRFRVCQLVASLLHGLSNDTGLADELYAELVTAMTERLRDRAPAARAILGQDHRREDVVGLVGAALPAGEGGRAIEQDRPSRALQQAEAEGFAEQGGAHRQQPEIERRPAVQPEAVAPAPIDEKYLTVRYERLVPLLLESVKALEDRIIELEAKLKG